MTSPHIVLLVLDTQRADRLSAYGYGRSTSPALEKLAGEGTRFEQAIAPAQWTIPSHVSMFTGVYPSVHGTVQSYNAIPPSLPTLAERLRAGGYYTAGFCNNPLVGVINNGLRRGFDSFLNYSGLLTDHPNEAGLTSNWLGRYRQGFKRLLANALGTVQDTFARSEALLALSFTPLMVPLWQTALSFKGNTAKSLQDAARLLCDRKLDEPPVFSFINLMGTHMPYHPPRQYVEKFAPEVLKNAEARRYLRQFNTDIYGWLAPLASPLNDLHKQTLDGMYDAEVAAQDAQLAIFFERLRSQGVLEKTVLIVCADHGEHLGEKQLVGHTNAIYNELARVPLIIHDPTGDFVPSTVRQEPVSTRRIFPTILSAAGLATEAEKGQTLAASLPADPVFSEAIPPQNVLKLLLKRQPELVQTRGYDQATRAVWSGDFKYLVTGNGLLDTIPQRQELYHWGSDPQESFNLCEILPEQVDNLGNLLQNFLAQQPAAIAAQADNFDDPLVARRLRDLGYLE